MNLKDETILEIQETLLQKADELRQDKNMIPEEKLEKISVILNTYKFLQKYDHNIEVLQKDFINRKYEIEK